MGFLKAEQYFCFFAFLFSLPVLFFSSHLFTLFLALEAQLLSFLILLSSGRGLLLLEGVLKYFFASSLVSAFFLLVFFFLLSSYGSLTLPLPPSPLLFLFLPLLFFKFSLFPLHYFFPDLLEITPLPLLPFWSAWAKFAIFLFFYKLFSSFPVIIIALSWFVGSLGAVHQSRVVRLIAYSSINTLSWVIWGSLLGLPLSFLFHSSFFFFYFITLIALVNWFRLLSCSYSLPVIFLGSVPAFFSFSLLILFFGLLGFPPLAGFLFKWTIVTTAFAQGSWFLSFFALLIGGLSIYYVVKITTFLYFSQLGFRKVLFNSPFPSLLNVIFCPLMFLFIFLWFRLSCFLF